MRGHYLAEKINLLADVLGHFDVDVIGGNAGFVREQIDNLRRGSAFDAQFAERAQIDSAIGIDGVLSVRKKRTGGNRGNGDKLCSSVSFVGSCLSLIGVDGDLQNVGTKGVVGLLDTLVAAGGAFVGHEGLIQPGRTGSAADQETEREPQDQACEEAQGADAPRSAAAPQ